MSQWTHVAGAVRYDSLPFFPDNKQRIQALIQENLPTGSEGPLTVTVEMTDDHSLNVANVLIAGDLRDFGSEDVQGVLEWFGRIAKPDKSHSLMVRQAVLTIEVEAGETVTLSLVDGEIIELTTASTSSPAQASGVTG